MSIQNCQPKNSENLEQPIASRLKWEGRTSVSYSIDSVSSKDSALNEVVSRKYLFQFTGLDSLKVTLLEFQDEDKAFMLFQKHSTSKEMQENIYFEKNHFIFFHGRYLGIADFPHPETVPVHFLRENLSMDDEELFRVPKNFQTFPIAGRIPKSERIFDPYFLGQKWPRPVFTVQYLNHEDTVTFFRTGPQKGLIKVLSQSWQGRTDSSNWKDGIHFMGHDELDDSVEIWESTAGIYGILNSQDSAFSQTNAEKMKKMTVLWTNP